MVDPADLNQRVGHERSKAVVEDADDGPLSPRGVRHRA